MLNIDFNTSCSRRVEIPYRIVVTIHKHVEYNEFLACRYQGIGIDESAQLRIIISALKVTQFCLYVVAVSGVSFSLPGGVVPLRGYGFDDPLMWSYGAFDVDFFGISIQ